jgi:hypothetical protein
MPEVFQTPTWSIEVPDGWTAVDEEEYATFQADGDAQVGALQISAYQKDGPVTNEDLEEFAEEHLSAGAIATPVDHPAFEGFGIAYETDEEFWTEWYLRAGDQMLYVTYTCPVDDQDAEQDVIAEMLGTLEPCEDEDADEDDSEEE